MRALDPLEAVLCATSNDQGGTTMSRTPTSKLRRQLAEDHGLPSVHDHIVRSGVLRPRLDTIVMAFDEAWSGTSPHCTRTTTARSSCTTGSTCAATRQVGYSTTATWSTTATDGMTEPCR